MLFANRQEAGQLLAKELKDYDKAPNAIILALPRGGLPIADEIRNALNLPLDICLVRKLGSPNQRELAIGAITMNNVRVLNQDVINSLGIPESEIERVTKMEQKELARRNQIYRKDRPTPLIKGKTVILVDDGLATGATMRAAIKGIKSLEAKEIIVAVPVSAADTYQDIKTEVNKIVCLSVPRMFFAVAQWYEDFPQVSDEEVEEILQKR